MSLDAIELTDICEACLGRRSERAGLAGDARAEAEVIEPVDDVGVIVRAAGRSRFMERGKVLSRRPS